MDTHTHTQNCVASRLREKEKKEKETTVELCSGCGCVCFCCSCAAGIGHDRTFRSVLALSTRLLYNYRLWVSPVRLLILFNLLLVCSFLPFF